jgi:hypothetical protein
MSNKPGRDRPRISRSLPHSSWKLDEPLLFVSRDATEDAPRAGARRKVTAEEIWAVVDAVN